MNKQQFTDSVFLSLETVHQFIDRPVNRLVWNVIDDKYTNESYHQTYHQTIYWCCEAVEEAVDKFPSRWKNKMILRSLL